MLPGWLGKIITITMSFISFIFNTIYWVFYFMVYPLKLIGWDMIENLKDYFKSDCMIINFRPALDKMKDGVLMLIPKFKPIKIKIQYAFQYIVSFFRKNNIIKYYYK